VHHPDGLMWSAALSSVDRTDKLAS